MDETLTRRTFIGAVGATVAGTLVAGNAVGAPVANRYVVDLRGTPASALRGLDVIHRLDTIDAAVVAGSAAAVRGLRCARDRRVGLPHPVAVVSARDHPAVVGPTHELGDGLASLADFQWDKRALRVDEAHALARGAGARVAVIDSGVDGAHPDLARRVNVALSRNFTADGGDFADVDGHGTHVAGIALADRGPAGTGVVGVAPAAELVACRIFAADGSATFGDALAAMVHAVDVDADVVNMSFGTGPIPTADPEVRTMRELIERVVAVGLESGTLFVGAAGNDASNLDEDGDVVDLPHEAAGVVSVSATGPIGFAWDDDRALADPLTDLREPTDTPAFYTNFGREAIDLSAAGGNADESLVGTTDVQWFLDLVFSTLPTALDETDPVGYGWAAGTSMAAPQVTGAVALLRERFPDASVAALRDHLLANAASAGSPLSHGEGHLDVLAALEAELEAADEDGEAEVDATATTGVALA